MHDSNRCRCGHDEDEHYVGERAVEEWAWDVETGEEYIMQPCQVDVCECDDYESCDDA